MKVITKVVLGLVFVTLLAISGYRGYMGNQPGFNQDNNSYLEGV